MNRLGMLVDLSHVSQETMEDTFRVSRAPIMFSHSNVYTLCNSVRNVHDDNLLRLVSIVLDLLKTYIVKHIITLYG